MKIQKKKLGGGVGGRGRVGGVRVDVNKETEVFVKIQKKFFFFFFGGGGGGGGGLGWGGGVRVDVNQELKFFGKFKKKKIVGGEGGSMGVRVGGSGWM